MAYVANPNGVAVYKAGTKYPRRLSKRESRVLQTTLDTAVNEDLFASGITHVLVATSTTLSENTFNSVASATITLTLPEITADNLGASIEIWNADYADVTVDTDAAFFIGGIVDTIAGSLSTDETNSVQGEFSVKYVAAQYDEENDPDGYAWVLVRGAFLAPPP